MRQETSTSHNLDRPNPMQGPLYSFIPAHGGCRAGAVAEQVSRALAEVPGFSVLLAGFTIQESFLWSPADSPRRLDGQTWGALVFDSRGLEVLDASDVYPHQLQRVLQYARNHYRTVCADLTRAKDVQIREALRASECIFIVSTSDVVSLEMAREKKQWLESLNLGDECGLLMERVQGGVSSERAEDIAGMPMCSLVDHPEYIERLAGWLASEETFASDPAYLTVN